MTREQALESALRAVTQMHCRYSHSSGLQYEDRAGAMAQARAALALPPDAAPVLPGLTPGSALTVEDDADGEPGFFSIWLDSGKGSGAELAGRIGERAYANLFAAAPDMLAALQYVSDAAPDDDSDGDPIQVTLTPEGMCSIRTVIARATQEG